MERRFGLPRTGPLALASSLLLSTACYTQATRDEASEDPPSFDAETAELRPAAYEPCTHYEQCPGLNSNCAAYTTVPEHQFCAAYCDSDDDCPVLPGYAATCNFAWCVLRCDDKKCPNGMTCIEDQTFIDHDGQSKGAGDVCVTTPGL